ncbi:MAG: divalent metal cation transporter, partial [Holophagales bacterium]|nr:divalent metal cation transporter [Holophagales bacterium]
MSSTTYVEQGRDPYTVREGGATPPPTNWRTRLRYLGPSVVISGAIVGSGEMILTSALGAAAGFVLLWWVLLSCWIKSLIQAELARYTLVSGDTYVRAMNRLPFRIRIGRGHVSFAVAITLVALVPGLLGMGGIIGGAGQALTLLVPELPSTLAAGLLAVITIAVLTTGSYRILENVMLALVIIFTGATLVCAILMQGTEFAVTRADLASGFTFSFPPEFIVAAMAVYGYSGVNSSETSAYQYWCVEKGYPNFIGRS